MRLPTNEAPIDRVIRVVLGIALVALALTGTVTSPLVYIVWVIAALALVTGIVGFCGLYAVLRISTKRAAH